MVKFPKIFFFIPYGIVLVAVLAFLYSSSMQAQVRIKCWKNEEGVRECGNQVPADYISKGHQVLDRRGFVVKEIKRELSEEEFFERKLQEKLEAEKKRLQREQELKDRMLLLVYSSIEEIEIARNDALKQLQLNIRVALKSQEKINAGLDRAIKAAAKQELRGDIPNESVLENIASLQRQLEQNERYIGRYRNKEAEIREEYALKIDRFIEIKKNREVLSIEDETTKEHK